MKEFKMDFYSTTNLKSYNLNESMRYQLAMLDSLDVFTRLHSENVANLTCRICEYMHLKDYFTVYCTICAYLHDIGKQFIPSRILQKNGSLTDEEFAVMKTHTTIGYNMCMRDEKLRPYATGTIYHHEALDGTGYPNGVSKKNLPLEGQIIRVADEFDAITAKRQYKSHVDICDTLKILINETYPNKKIGAKIGKLNPKVVKALIKVVIDDTEYELYNLGEYVKYLEKEVNRLKQIASYGDKMNNAHSETDRAYYANGISALLDSGETFENYKTVLNEYIQASIAKKQQMDKLNEELSKIKKLKV